MVSDTSLRPIPQNFKKQVDWIFGAYDDAGIILCDGFQKDAIQNAVGARLNASFSNWKCSIDVITNDKGNFLVIEDTGTAGLTGPNYSTDQIQLLMSKAEAGNTTLSNKYRLVRFSSMNNSGDNKTGGGLYGVGKAIYSVASSKYIYYFDSIRYDDNKYVANKNEQGLIHDCAFEDEEAKQFIFKETGLSPKTSPGTRVIIAEPRNDLSSSIISGEVKQYIIQTWWRLMERMGENSGIYVNGEKVCLPEKIAYTREYNLAKEYTYSEGYRVKHFGLYVSEENSITWKGIAYYRKGMRIGNLDVMDTIPEKIKDKCWGYVEVDEEWEEELAAVEDRIHNGVSKGKKKSKCYQCLKDFVQHAVHDQMVQWGYIKEQRDEQSLLDNKLTDIAKELETLFSKSGFEELGTGEHKAPFEVRLMNVHYPVDGTIRVSEGDKISFDFKITNNGMDEREFLFSAEIQDKESKESLGVITKQSCKVEGSSNVIEHVEYFVSEKTARKNSLNTLVLKVICKGNKAAKIKTLDFGFDCDRDISERDTVLLSLSKCIFPMRNSRRINSNEYLVLGYRIDNRRNTTLPYRLNVSVYDGEPSANKIFDVYSKNGKINPFEEEIIDVGQICFDKTVIEDYLSQGVLEVRARVIANETNEFYDKGDKITDYRFKVYWNCNEKNGLENSFKVRMSEDAPHPYMRSWNVISGSDRTIYINQKHAAYLSVKDNEEYQRDYLKEQMLKQFILLYVKEGKLEKFSNGTDTFESMEPQEAVEKVFDLIEEVYSKSL